MNDPICKNCLRPKSEHANMGDSDGRADEDLLICDDTPFEEFNDPKPVLEGEIVVVVERLTVTLGSNVQVNLFGKVGQVYCKDINHVHDKAWVVDIDGLMYSLREEYLRVVDRRN